GTSSRSFASKVIGRLHVRRLSAILRLAHPDSRVAKSQVVIAFSEMNPRKDPFPESRRRIPVREVVVEFSFLRASRSMLAAGIIALLASTVCVATGSAQATAAQQPAGQGQKNWKDRAEYDLYIKITQTQDPKARLQLLNDWQQKYPKTDFDAERSQAFVATLGQIAQTDPSQRQAAIDKCEEILKADPKNFTAAY